MRTSPGARGRRECRGSGPGWVLAAPARSKLPAGRTAYRDGKRLHREGGASRGDAQSLAAASRIVERRFKIEGRAADDLQHLGRRLLLQRLARSRVRACTSSNRRAFSIAITAWSAKVSHELDLTSAEGRASARVSMKTPDTWPSRSSGTPRMAIVADARREPVVGYSGSSRHVRDACDRPSARSPRADQCSPAAATRDCAA